VSHPDGRIDHVRETLDAHGQLPFDGMPERLFVCTPSKLAAFEDCPRRYRFAYLDRPAPPKGPAWAHNSLGASVHTALRSWHGLDPAQEPVGVERVVGVKTATLALSGRVDRIDRRGEELVIVDYKTGRAGVSSDDARGSRALALYAFATQRVFRRRCRRVELHHLPSHAVASHEHTDESLDRHVRRAEDTARDAVEAERAVATGTDPDAAFPTRPGPICSWCDYRRNCPDGTNAPAKQPWSGIGVLRDGE
jgi:putative RecB family exonuclease